MEFQPNNFERQEVKEIDLSVEKIPEPLDAHRVHEGKYIISGYNSERPYLSTYGIDSCRALVFYESSQKKGLMSHLARVKNSKEAINNLISSFGNFDNTACYIMEALVKLIQRVISIIGQR